MGFASDRGAGISSRKPIRPKTRANLGANRKLADNKHSAPALIVQSQFDQPLKIETACGFGALGQFGVVPICDIAMLVDVVQNLPLLTPSLHDRSGMAKIVSEIVATFGLVGVILSCATHRKDAIPYAVAAYIGAGYWFTVSTSFATGQLSLRLDK